MKKKIIIKVFKKKIKGLPALCETGAELCDLLIHDNSNWYHVLVNDCLDKDYNPQLKAVYREGLTMYHRHIEQLLAYTAKTDQIFKV